MPRCSCPCSVCKGKGAVVFELDWPTARKSGSVGKTLTKIPAPPRFHPGTEFTQDGRLLYVDTCPRCYGHGYEGGSTTIPPYGIPVPRRGSYGVRNPGSEPESY